MVEYFSIPFTINLKALVISSLISGESLAPKFSHVTLWLWPLPQAFNQSPWHRPVTNSDGTVKLVSFYERESARVFHSAALLDLFFHRFSEALFFYCPGKGKVYICAQQNHSCARETWTPGAHWHHCHLKSGSLLPIGICLSSRWFWGLQTAPTRDGWQWESASEADS